MRDRREGGLEFYRKKDMVITNNFGIPPLIFDSTSVINES
jgi:hypothetical protein